MAAGVSALLPSPSLSGGPGAGRLLPVSRCKSAESMSVSESKYAPLQHRDPEFLFLVVVLSRRRGEEGDAGCSRYSVGSYTWTCLV